MRIAERETNTPMEFYVVDEDVEKVCYQYITRYIVDKKTFQKYFPEWNSMERKKQKGLSPKRKRE